MSWCGGGEIRPDARRGVPHFRDPRVDLVSGKLAALARLGALRHLDLQLVGIDQILAGDTEASRRDLLDRAALRVAVRHGQEALRILTALARVGAAAEAIHRDGQRLVRFLADRAVGHRARREPLDDLRDRLDLVDRDGRTCRLETEQTSQRRASLVLRVHGAGVFLEDRVLAASRRVLQLEDGLGVEQMVLAVATPLILAARVEL